MINGGCRGPVIGCQVRTNVREGELDEGSLFGAAGLCPYFMRIDKSFGKMIQLRFCEHPFVSFENDLPVGDSNLRFSRKADRLQRLPTSQIPCRKTMPV